MSSLNTEDEPILLIPSSQEVPDDESSDSDHSWKSEEMKEPISTDDESSETSKFPQFNEAAKFGNVSLELGMEFNNLELFKEAVKDYTINSGRPITWEKNDAIRVRAKCQEEECRWEIFCSENKGRGSYQVKTFNNEHTCCKTNWLPQADKKWVVHNQLEMCQRCGLEGHNSRGCTNQGVERGPKQSTRNVSTEETQEIQETQAEIQLTQSMPQSSQAVTEQASQGMTEQATEGANPSVQPPKQASLKGRGRRYGIRGPVVPSTLRMKEAPIRGPTPINPAMPSNQSPPPSSMMPTPQIPMMQFIPTPGLHQMRPRQQ